MKKTPKQYKYVKIHPDSTESLDAILYGTYKESVSAFTSEKMSGAVLLNSIGEWYIPYNGCRYKVKEVEPMFNAVYANRET